MRKFSCLLVFLIPLFLSCQTLRELKPVEAAVVDTLYQAAVFEFASKNPDTARKTLEIIETGRELLAAKKGGFYTRDMVARWIRSHLQEVAGDENPFLYLFVQNLFTFYLDGWFMSDGAFVDNEDIGLLIHVADLTENSIMVALAAEGL